MLNLNVSESRRDLIISVTQQEEEPEQGAEERLQEK